MTKTHTITKNGSHGTATYYPGNSKFVFPSLYYSPVEGFIGEDIIKYRVTNDGTDDLVDDDTEPNPMSDEKTIRITVK